MVVAAAFVHVWLQLSETPTIAGLQAAYLTYEITPAALMSSSPMRVLLTEDDHQRAAVLEACLHRAGHEVIIMAACSKQVLEAIRLIQPDLVVLGCPLRGSFDAVTFMAVLQTSESAPVPVMLVSDPIELLALV